MSLLASHKTVPRAGRTHRSHGSGNVILAVLMGDAVAAGIVSVALGPLGGEWAVAAALPGVWLLCLGTCGAYEPYRVRTGTEEFGRVWRALGAAFVGAVAVWWVVQGDEMLRDAAVALPVTAALTLAVRSGERHWTPVGRDPQWVLVVGAARRAVELIMVLRRSNATGLRVVGVCLTDPTPPDVTGFGVQVYGGMDGLMDTVRRTRCDAVVVVPNPEIGAGEVRELSWQLHREGVALVLAPVLADVVPSRLAVWPVAGVPLLHVRGPTLSRVRRIPKELTDRLLAALLLVLLSPLMLAIALTIRIDSSGPALFCHRRIGLGGRPFTLLKFRTMYQDAERRKAELVSLNQYGDGPFFKMTDDPRVTRVGLVLRRCSLDELPQLFNVVAGRMSLVGPRPLLAEEIVALGVEGRRRLLVKPGLSGLWQVSGRSRLSAEDRARLDMSYVENWTPALDVKILLRTPPAVVRGSGAY
ncbi:sugar transferase [Streptomyces aquilus]|uniref:Sugar transferase n=2 Tax=Streptomyces aquilus TaxID=2548456 RepID=A0A3Q9C6B4_9ACTN|nr:sugar transferase [Streptomyces aquilus]